ncbi:hypothetical protein [Acidithiobacillus caldus]|uniref:Uncharacterized protein n=1 Tax=Acidithiobacillus caldus TaxID=33059 RepID=A0A1E7Z054_9PROT|nr:hypothetical protein [Acidithiobacillus caldus]OFC35544.1 hypothetical protein BAE29_15445 [Acidithiobacillus caldus]OFC36393.1 hypothetical protein BAE27_06345 [Acidithiobacillus caldus]OFC40459.1 hypothetical protein BAE28_00165 [Acidithiobacillus caldus]OFC62160.1 hypothetical protein BAE30_02775 [Acidithiobacillus caldus]
MNTEISSALHKTAQDIFGSIPSFFYRAMLVVLGLFFLAVFSAYVFVPFSEVVGWTFFGLVDGWSHIQPLTWAALNPLNMNHHIKMWNHYFAVGLVFDCIIALLSINVALLYTKNLEKIREENFYARFRMQEEKIDKQSTDDNA